MAATNTISSRVLFPKFEKEIVAQYIIDNGNDLMKEFANEYKSYRSGYMDARSLFYVAFPYPNKIRRGDYDYSKDDIICIATVYLFIKQNCLFNDNATLLNLYDAIKKFFEVQDNGIKELICNPDHSILLSDLYGYWQIWKQCPLVRDVISDDSCPDDACCAPTVIFN